MRRLLFRFISVGLAALICFSLASKIGPWQMVGVWAIAMAFLCAIAALLLRSTRVGQVSWKNYVAGWILAWGYAIGRGKLLGIALVSWAVWVLIAIGVATHGESGDSQWSAREISGAHGASMWLIVSWAVDVIGLFYLLGQVAKRFDARSRATRTQLLLCLIILSLILASVGLWLADNPRAALLVAGGPPLALGVIFALFALVIATVGRGAPWN